MHADAQHANADRGRLALALLISLLLHAPVFLPTGGWRIGTLDKPVSPALQVSIESPQRESDHEEALVQERRSERRKAAPLTPEPVGEPELLELPVELGEEQFADLAQEPAEPADLEAGDSFQQVEPSAPAEPVPADEAIVATLAPAQQRAVTRQLVRAARELLDTRDLQRPLTFRHENREFSAVLTRQPAGDGMDIERVSVELSSEHGGERIQTSLQLKRLVFSHFTQLVDQWDPWVQLHDDEIAGRFHSNSEINLSYDRTVAPRLLGRVTTARGIRFTNEKGWRPRRKIFVGGLTMRTPRIRLPAIALPVAQAAATRGADVQLVRADTLIVFHPDGTYDRVEVATRVQRNDVLAPDRLTYLIGVQDAELRVRGVVNGRVTVYSPRRILVQGDLTYARDPRIDPDADDYLGLVSDGTVEIDRASVTGPGDLDVHAAIYARRRFVVRNIGARGGTLAIFGSVTAGTLSATEPRYATRTEFDSRFEDARPPGFPETDTYEIEGDASWRVAKAKPKSGL